MREGYRLQPVGASSSVASYTPDRKYTVRSCPRFFPLRSCPYSCTPSNFAHTSSPSDPAHDPSLLAPAQGLFLSLASSARAQPALLFPQYTSSWSSLQSPHYVTSQGTLSHHILRPPHHQINHISRREREPPLGTVEAGLELVHHT